MVVDGRVKLDKSNSWNLLKSMENLSSFVKKFLKVAAYRRHLPKLMASYERQRLQRVYRHRKGMQTR